MYSVCKESVPDEPTKTVEVQTTITQSIMVTMESAMEEAKSLQILQTTCKELRQKCDQLDVDNIFTIYL